MYTKLEELGLKEYISTCCGGTMQEDKYFRNIEKFISTLSEDNFKSLISKFRGNKKYSEITDLLHEVEIACVFHPKANFLENGPDLENGILIEVKTLNESKEEYMRHQNDPNFFISQSLSDEEKKKEEELVDIAIYNKAIYHLEKANSQLKGRGLIYLIWDYDLLLHGEDGQVHFPIPDGKRLMQMRIEKIVKEFIGSHPGLIIKTYYFGDLRELVSDPLS